MDRPWEGVYSGYVTVLRDGKKKTMKALAFQQATLALRERYPDPYYWAPFTLVGDWR